MTPACSLVVTGMRGTPKIDPKMAAKVLGPDIASEYPGITVGAAIDKLLKESPRRIASTQASQLKQLIRKEFGAAKVKTTRADAVEQES